MTTTVSVAICTWNRAHLLHQTLTRMAELVIPAGLEWEVLVVNNNCTDDTDTVIARHAARLPIRRLLETKQGQSNARNCAIDHARGNLIIWTDDDVLVETNWLAAYVSAAERHPTAGYFGGRITPWFEAEPPAWVTRNLILLEPLLVVRDLTVNERPIVGQESPFGANMMFRSAVLANTRFDPNLGRVKDAGILADETQLFERLRAQGIEGVWVPDAAVRHFVTSVRLTRRYLWNYFHGLGRTAVRTGGFADHGEPKLWGAPRWLYRLAWRHRIDAFIRWLTGREWVPAYVEAARRAGAITELRHRAATPPLAPAGGTA